jgi:hypothetical protein
MTQICFYNKMFYIKVLHKNLNTEHMDGAGMVAMVLYTTIKLFTRALLFADYVNVTRTVT